MVYTAEAQDRLTAVRKRIEETNKQFLEASRPEKRVMVARDILFQLEIGRLIPRSTYVGPDAFYNSLAPPDLPVQIQDFMQGIPSCEVCGIGALFIAVVERLDDFTLPQFREFNDPQAAIQYYLSIKGLFTEDELLKIERFFELHITSSDCYLWRYTSKYVRMRHLAQTLIDTNGAEITHKTFHAPPTEEQLKQSSDDSHWRHAYDHYMKYDNVSTT